MSNELKDYRKEAFKDWILEQVDQWKHEYSAWDGRIEDEEDDFNEEDWEWIRDNLSVSKIEVSED